MRLLRFFKCSWELSKFWTVMLIVWFVNFVLMIWINEIHLAITFLILCYISLNELRLLLMEEYIDDMKETLETIKKYLKK